jgi:hypothetical protein
MKSLEELMFGKDYQDGARKAITEAVARANAAGLPKAYKELDRSKEPAAPKGKPQ